MDFLMELLKAALFGVVEGITEWLPISSTGHMILLNEIVRMNVGEDFWGMFLVVIQLGAILAVVLLFWNKIFPFDFSKKGKEIVRRDIFSMWFKIVAACIPAAVVGIFFDDLLERYLYNPLTVAVMLILFGVGFLLIEGRNRGKKPRIDSLDAIGYREALLIGLFQLIAAVFPGTSRSGATILGGLMIGVSRTVAAEFTFFLAIPVMLGASLLKLVKFGISFTGMEAAILAVGMIVAFAVSMAVIRFLMGYIRRHDFRVFGWYRIALGALVLAWFFL